MAVVKPAPPVRIPEETIYFPVFAIVSRIDINGEERFVRSTQESELYVIDIGFFQEQSIIDHIFEQRAMLPSTWTQLEQIFMHTSYRQYLSGYMTPDGLFFPNERDQKSKHHKRYLKIEEQIQSDREAINDALQPKEIEVEVEVPVYRPDWFLTLRYCAITALTTWFLTNIGYAVQAAIR